LGERRLVRAHGGAGIAWNPAGDHRVAAEVLLGTGIDDDWVCSAELTAAIPKVI
jgi:hypothetical protein